MLLASLSILLAFEMLTTRCSSPPVLTWSSGDLPVVRSSLYTLSMVCSTDYISCRCHGCDTLLFLSSDTKIEAHVSALLNICSWKSAHHRHLSLDKTELFFFPGKSCSLHDLSITRDKTLAQSAKIYNTTTVCQVKVKLHYNLILQV